MRVLVSNASDKTGWVSLNDFLHGKPGDIILTSRHDVDLITDYGIGTLGPIPRIFIMMIDGDRVDFRVEMKKTPPSNWCAVSPLAIREFVVSHGLKIFLRTSGLLTMFTIDDLTPVQIMELQLKAPI